MKAVTDGSGDLWVFGYGSLMWRPGFPFVERRHAQLYGYRRALCVLSHVHRGTPENPGLVLGLDRGGRCHGVAFRVAKDEAEATVHYLREREQVTSVYLERHLSLRLDDGSPVTALGYVADRKHQQYAGNLGFEEVLALVRQGKGISGANPDYVRSTHEHLLTMGVVDPLMQRIVEALDQEA
ncbi:gamma-glutamylcyclotransferase [Microvirga sp. ACRRW]|uniref:gamma-glutamylcyclotransferase n=1 Tax=Microvirga sp. ACRRW TaxID=2918205 RepID=UPI001EF5ABD8|nr:gamma-glutamylcyclotransferase [Microvirga sp. ACRRW]MCG7393593.1 gamma-glutamylcyclotransferase [Microvirga sp. ACRRW]